MSTYAQHRRYFRQRGDNICPRFLFRTHFEKELKTWLDKGDMVMIFIDANKDLSKGHLKSMFHCLGMNDAIQQRVQLANKHKAYKNLGTIFRGRRQIDRAFLSQALQYNK